MVEGIVGQPAPYDLFLGGGQLGRPTALPSGSRLNERQGVMKAKLLSERGEKTYAVIFETGDEVVSGLTSFATEQHLAASHLTAIGAFQDVTLGYFDWQKKHYQKVP